MLLMAILRECIKYRDFIEKHRNEWKIIKEKEIKDDASLLTLIHKNLNYYFFTNNNNSFSWPSLRYSTYDLRKNRNKFIAWEFNEKCVLIFFTLSWNFPIKCFSQLNLKSLLSYCLFSFYFIISNICKYIEVSS